MSSLVVDWSEINPEIIDLIMKRLDLIEFIRAGAVCRSWYSSKQICRYISPPNSYSPWLILSSPHQPEFRYVSNPADPQSLYKFNLPDMKYHFIVGSSHGFIVSIDEIARAHVTNPITGSHRLLPAITTLPCCKGAVYDPVTNQISSYLIQNSRSELDPPDVIHVHHVPKYFYHKIALFPTCSSAGLISVLLYSGTDELAFALQSDESWTIIKSPNPNFEDVLFYKGLLYAVNWQGELFAFDILNFSVSSTPVISVEGWPLGNIVFHSRKYLVQSPCGSDLFIIARFTDFIGVNSEQTVGFKIYKLNYEDDYQCSEVSSFGIDPVVVFLGFSPSVMLLAKDIPNMAVNKGDSIYFIDDNFFRARHERQNTFDMGIFYMEDNKVLPLDIINEDLQWYNYHPPFWFMPVNA